MFCFFFVVVCIHSTILQTKKLFKKTKFPRFTRSTFKTGRTPDTMELGDTGLVKKQTKQIQEYICTQVPNSHLHSGPSGKVIFLTRYSNKVMAGNK